MTEDKPQRKTSARNPREVSLLLGARQQQQPMASLGKQATYESALLAAGSTLDLVDAVAAGRLQNSFAIVRPPGHHAMESEFCSYCLVNSVALAARHALNTHRLSRTLVVDWDVHHGQATQQA
ncbi:polyamine deacetylase HDAC10-like [Eriocheir sinensis]|uniref:polyamine deacetylase HDAC10-like n=1 Tax=Eriocheir sinensis TaxID=95602 RepID=UPI0021C5D74F|nr:polyamine deacetylase HDAC10-like [Eriocheir sinensis]